MSAPYVLLVSASVKLTVIYCLELDNDVLPAAERTADHFSVLDYVSWVQDLSVAYQMSLHDKLEALDTIQYNNISLTSVLRIWEKAPQEINGKAIIISHMGQESEPLSYEIDTFLDYCQHFSITKWIFQCMAIFILHL